MALLLSFQQHPIHLIFHQKLLRRDWNNELQDRTSKFWKHTTAIVEWDRRILQNRNVLISLELPAFGPCRWRSSQVINIAIDTSRLQYNCILYCLLPRNPRVAAGVLQQQTA